MTLYVYDLDITESCIFLKFGKPGSLQINPAITRRFQVDIAGQIYNIMWVDGHGCLSKDNDHILVLFRVNEDNGGES